MAGEIDRILMQQGMSAAEGPDVFEMARALGQQGDKPGRDETPGTGVGIIDIFTAPKRRREQADINIDEAKKRANAIVDSSRIDLEGFSPRAQQGLQQLALSDFAAFKQEVEQIQQSQGINPDFVSEADKRAQRVELYKGINTAKDEMRFKQGKEIFTQEGQLRKEYQTRLGPVNQGRIALGTAMASMDLASPLAAFNTARAAIGQGDTSMFATDEFSNFIDQFGLADQVGNIQSYIDGEGRVGVEARKSVIRDMKAVQNGLEKYAEAQGEIFKGIAERSQEGPFPLDIRNITNFEPVLHDLDGSITAPVGSKVENADGSFTVVDANGLTRTVRKVED